MRSFNSAIFLIATITAITLASSARAAELYFLGGTAMISYPSNRTYSWQLEYRQDILKHLGIGISYLNEGHVEEHHRDGYTAQLWGRTDLFDDRLTVAAGVGPYFYLDTTRSSSDPLHFSNEHRVKAMASVAAAYHLSNDLILELRSNWVGGGAGFDSTSILGGIGYHFDPDLKPLPGTPKGEELEPRNEVTVFAGQTIVNSFNSQKSVAAAVEYRRRMSRHIDLTLSGIYEGDNRLIRRDGIVTQVWAAQELLEGMFSVAAGAGAYFDVSHYTGGNDTVSGIITLSGSYRFTPHWALRVSWNRLVTRYNRDTDVILGGIGYRF
jgi:hypothetical protein